MGVEEEEGEVAALLHNYLNMVEVITYLISVISFLWMGMDGIWVG